MTVFPERIAVAYADDLGAVYGLLHLSETALGVAPFWFWNDQKLQRRETVQIPCGEYAGKPAAVRYRGWFINDEVLLSAWSLDGSRDKPWEMAFEALLRLGGNLVIPGTDKNAHRYRELAASYGLYVTHHHAEPLGAQMFRRAYPGLNASYAEHPALFEQLWRDAILAQKDMKVVWNLGFRGQGDCPFWEDDPQYDTPEKRGALISRLIRRQYDMVQEALPGAACCTNLYGEVMELYREGLISLPDDIIRIWADNGYGRMVTRRQNNHNPRICALPPEGSTAAHGVYLPCVVLRSSGGQPYDAAAESAGIRAQGAWRGDAPGRQGLLDHQLLQHQAARLSAGLSCGALARGGYGATAAQDGILRALLRTGKRKARGGLLCCILCERAVLRPA